MIPSRRPSLAAAVVLAALLTSCRPLAPVRRPPPAAGVGGTAVAETALPPASETAPAATATATAAATATVAPTASPTATVAAALPLPGRRLPAAAWRTLLHAPGLADMSVAGDLGPNTHLAVATGNGGLNSLRADLRQPANAWVTGVPSDTIVVGAFLGRRRGEGHDIEIVDAAVEDGVVNLALRVSAPGQWHGTDEVFPVHLIALDRAALPAGPLSFHFLDADALAPAAPAPAFDETLAAVDLGTDTLARREFLIIQSASEPAADPTPTP